MNMAEVRVALAQINSTVGDLDGNAALALQAIERASGAGADLVALPELAICGYPPEDLVLRPSFVEDNISSLKDLAPEVRSPAAVIGFIDQDEMGAYNAAALIVEGKVAGVYRKHRLPNYGVFDEERYFEPGEGILLAKVGETLIGITICEDVWSFDGPHVQCAAAGADMIVNINGSPYHRGKGGERLELLRKRAAENEVAFVYVNMVGGQDELVFDGQSMAVSAQGELLARAAHFEEELLVFDFVVKARGRRSGRPGAVEAVKIVELGGRSGSRGKLELRLAEELGPAEEVYRALVLGVRDYLGKNGFSNAFVGLSGGIDSSLTAAIARDAIGGENVTGVLMPSGYTSGESTEYGERVISNLGLGTATLSIEALHGAFLGTLEPAFAETDSAVAEENIQSRIRGTLLMALSNSHRGSIVLSTGNKSELAVGYATLYGDMSGGFAVLKDVPKTLVYEIAKWRNKETEVIPQEVIDRPPTAELRPEQLDTDSLPPYEILDPILEAYVEDDRSVEEIVAMGFDRTVVSRVARMVDVAEYKRRQAPPGIKITERAFGRDRRLPITNRYRSEPPRV